MADSKQFGSPRILQFGDTTGAAQSADAGHCAECEAMLADALDGTLSAADQQIFDTHMAECGPCSQLLADARRGAAFLEMLRHPAPQPPAALLERILTQTSGIPMNGIEGSGMPAIPLPAASFPVPAQPVGHFGVGFGQAAPAAAYSNVLPFPRRTAAAFRSSGLGQIMLQPRLAMTAAMAFFSITLTMNLMGIHPLSLRAADLAPGNLKRNFYSANARVVQYYEGLRVVYELESRVHDLQTGQDGDAMSNQPEAQPAPANSAQPQQPAQQQATPPAANQPQRKRPAPDAGTSRREDLQHHRREMLASDRDPDLNNPARVRVERTLV